MKKRIIVDLDVTTVAKWDKSQNGDLGRKFIIRVEKGEFEMIIPYIILNLINEWRHKKLVKEIRDFYDTYSEDIISVINLEEKIIKLNIDRTTLTSALESLHIKDEDTILVIIASIFGVDYLVTFNRKHLKNNEVKINNVLQKYGLKTIKIVLPDEA